MATIAQGANPDGALKTWSCVICRRRKVRCNRKDPCSNCVKNNIECHFPVTGRIPRRIRGPTAWKSPAQKQEELLSRLRRLEAVVTELAGQVEDAPASQSSGSKDGQATSVDSDNVVTMSSSAAGAPVSGSEFEEEFGRLVIDQGGGVRVGNRFWSVFCDEVCSGIHDCFHKLTLINIDNILQAIHDVTSHDEEPSSLTTPESWSDEAASSYSHQGFIFGSSGATRTPRKLYPLPSQMLFIWQTYIESVKPFVKILYVPAVDKLIRDFRGDFSRLGPPQEALLISISLAAIVTLDEDDVLLNFNIPKAQLLAWYRVSTEQALSRAELLSTKDLTVIQAFVIYLSIFPRLGTKQLEWPLTGLLLRLAVRLDLHRDGFYESQSSKPTPLRRGTASKTMVADMLHRRAKSRCSHARIIDISPHVQHCGPNLWR